MKAAWPIVRLDECAEILSGATPSTSVKAYWDGDICWATPKDLSDLDGAYIFDTPRKITRAGLESCAAAILPSGSVLFSSRAPIGHVAVNAVPMSTNQGFKSFVPKSDCIDAKFLYWWLRANRSFLQGLGNGATFKEVSKTIVSRIKVPLPPLAEQRRIAEVLDRAEALRSKRGAALAQLDSLIRSIFLDLFGDPATNPKALAKEKLEELTLSITDGKHGDCRPSPNSGYFFVSVKDIQDGQIDYHDARQIHCDDFAEVHKRTKLEAGDVLITNSGTIGKTAVVKSSPQLERTTFQKSVAIVKPRREKLESHYLRSALDMCVAKLSRVSSGSSQKNLLLGQLREFSICVPPIAMQGEFSRQVAAVEKLKAAQRASLAEMDELLASLQHRAFRGEL